MPDDHKCLHEIDLALIAERQERSLSLMEEIKTRQQEVLTMIFGNGEPGLKTEQKRQGYAIKGILWGIGVIIISLVGLAFRSLF